MAVKFPQFFFEPPDGVSRAGAPAPVSEVPTDPDTILGIALDVGAETLRCGGEIHRVEDTVTRICRAYGAEAVDVFAITSLITAEVRMPDGTSATRVRRLPNTYNHLARLEACNALSRAICQTPVAAAVVEARLDAIHHYRPIPRWLHYVGAMLATGGCAVFFGGTWLDGLAAAAIALLLTLLGRLHPVRMHGMVKTLISSFLGGVLSALFVRIGFGHNVDKVIIGTIMLEIPGLSFGNALRDLLCGDTLAGTMRSIQAVLQALMIAAGYMAALLLLNALMGGVV